MIKTQFLIIKNWKQPKCQLVGNWLNKLWSINIKEDCSQEQKNKMKETREKELPTEVELLLRY